MLNIYGIYLYYFKIVIVISLTVSNGEAIGFDRLLFFFYSLNKKLYQVVPAITQPPFGVGASSLDITFIKTSFVVKLPNCF